MTSIIPFSAGGGVGDRESDLPRLRSRERDLDRLRLRTGERLTGSRFSLRTSDRDLCLNRFRYAASFAEFCPL